MVGMDDLLFRLEPVLLLAVPAAAAITIVVVLEVARGKWRFTVRGLLLTMTFVAAAIVFHALRK
jgi:hypothetical protein